VGVIGTLHGITVDGHSTACYISAKPYVHDNQRSVGIKSVEQDLDLVDAHVRF
jgi:hypothetical protein